MNYLDILIIIPLLWGGYRGFTKGLIIEVASLAALALGVYGAIKFSGFISGILIHSFGMTSKYIPVISFAIVFVGIVILVHLVAKITDRMVKAAALGLPNRLLGAAFGILKFILIMGVLITILNRFDKNNTLLSPEIKKQSLLYQPMTDLTAKIFPSIQEIGGQAINREDKIVQPDKKIDKLTLLQMPFTNFDRRIIL